MVTAAQLRTMLDAIPGTKLLLLDACHSGAVIGKGTPDSFLNVFQGKDYKVICSSGGAEDSWFWAGAAGGSAPAVGAGYFSGALASGLSRSGGYGADANRDGMVTLTELRRYLRSAYGASTVQTYPQEDDFAVITYNVQTFSGRATGQDIQNVCFEEDALNAADPSISLSFTVLHDTRLAYQVVYRQNGCWDFDQADFMWDTGDENSYLPGSLSVGYHERTITLQMEEDADESGYVLLQLLTVKGDSIHVISSHVLCVLPSQGDPQLSINAPSSFSIADGGELTFSVAHALPCELTVTIETPDGDIVRRLASCEATRPEHMAAASFTWSGRTADDEPAEPGLYIIHVRTRIGGLTYEARTECIELLPSL